jgi:alkyl hydroperoxide reductase subunit AhpC
VPSRVAVLPTPRLDPSCNHEVRELAKAFGEFERRGVTPIAVSVDRPDKASVTGASYQVIAMPVLFLVDRGGVVRWAHSSLDDTRRPSTAQVLAAIDAAKLSPR